jgi:hypothetical protein
MTLPVIDNFPYSDGDLATISSGKWATAPGFGGLTVSTNKLLNTASAWNCCYWTADSFNNNQYSLCLLIDSGGWLGPAVRIAAAGSGNMYFIMPGDPLPNGVRFFKVINGSFTQLGSTVSRTNVDGEIWKLSISGTTLTANIAGVDVATQDAGSELTSGYAGITICTSYKTMDNWEGGNVGVGGGSTPEASLKIVKGSSGSGSGCFLPSENEAIETISKTED